MELGPYRGRNRFNKYRCCGEASQINAHNYTALERTRRCSFANLAVIFPLCIVISFSLSFFFRSFHFFLTELWLRLLIPCPAGSWFCLPLAALLPNHGALPARRLCCTLCFQGVKLPELVSSYEWLVDRMSSYGRYDISLCVCVWCVCVCV